MYDYVIVGCGLYGITFARLATDAGKKCLIIDKKNHIGGNCYTEEVEGINVHVYGPHIFHTSSPVVWDFVNKFAEFNNYTTYIKAHSDGKMYSLPFNMNTFYELWGTKTPKEAIEKIESQKFHGEPSNLEEQALSLVGTDIYEKLIKNYTTKQWGREPKDLPAFIIKRLPVRFTFNDNYFNDKHQGVPIGGFTKMFEKMLDGIEVRLETDYFDNKEYFNSIADKVVYTGCIDEFFDYEFGPLEYRSLRFETKVFDEENYQGSAIINYCDEDTPYTRSTEHKHFENSVSDKTVVTFEYPAEYDSNMVQYYPVNNDKNQEVYNKYFEKTKELPKIIFGGRLAEYKYMDMHVVIASAISKFKFLDERI